MVLAIVTTLSAYFPMRDCRVGTRQFIKNGRHLGLNDGAAPFESEAYENLTTGCIKWGSLNF